MIASDAHSIRRISQGSFNLGRLVKRSIAVEFDGVTTTIRAHSKGNPPCEICHGLDLMSLILCSPFFLLWWKSVCINSIFGSILPLDDPVMILCSSFMHDELPLHGPC